MEASHVKKTKQVSVRLTENTLNKIDEKRKELSELIKSYGMDSNVTTASYIRAVLINRLEKEEAEDFSNIINVELDIETMSDSLLKELYEYAHSMYKLESEKDIDGYKPKTFNYLSLASDVYRVMKLKGVK